MDSPSSIILTPFNYHKWKAKISILWCSRGLYRVTLDLENEPNAVIKKDKWHNRLDEAYGLIFLSIYLDILFHIDIFTTPNQVCTQLESLFGVQDELRVHQLEIELFSLIPSNFEYIEGLFTNFKSLFLILKKCGIDKEYDPLIISILSKLVPDYSVFFIYVSCY